MAKKRKIRITESQYEVIKESENAIDDYRQFSEKSIKFLNAQFGKLAFASMADIMDGDIDLDKLEQAVSKVENDNYTRYGRVTDFFNKHTSEDEYWDKWEKIHRELEELDSKIEWKLITINSVIGGLKEVADVDVDKAFSDIETRKI